MRIKKCFSDCDKAFTSGKSYTDAISQLEKELFEAASSDDEYDFTFLTGQKKSTSLGLRQEEASNTAEVNQELDDGSLFVIDRTTSSVTEKNRSPADFSKHTDVSGNNSDVPKSRKDIIAWARVIPTSLQVKEIPTIFDEKSSRKPQLIQNNKEPEIMKKSVITADFEQKSAVPPYSESKKALAKKRREERSKTKGSDWFDMKAPEMTEELQADIEALQMRKYTSSWTGYRKNDYKEGSKFFQIGTVEDSPVDFYTTRIPKKDRKRTLVDELLADADFRKNNKKMYAKAMEKLNRKHPKKKFKSK